MCLKWMARFIIKLVWAERINTKGNRMWQFSVIIEIFETFTAHGCYKILSVNLSTSMLNQKTNVSEPSSVYITRGQCFCHCDPNNWERTSLKFWFLTPYSRGWLPELKDKQNVLFYLYWHSIISLQLCGIQGNSFSITCE